MHKEEELSPKSYLECPVIWRNAFLLLCFLKTITKLSNIFIGKTII